MEENQEEIAEVMDEAPQVEQPAEKMLTQTQVNHIVQREKQQAAERARRQAEQEFQQQMQQQQAQQAEAKQQEMQSQSKEANAEALYQQVQERFNQEMQQKQAEAEIAQVAQSYHQKMEAGKGSYEDFEDITSKFDPTAFPQLVYLISGLDNASDIVYELSKNPSKLVTLDTLAHKSPSHAQAELNSLSKSIRENKTAQAEAGDQQVNAPLDRIQPSRVSSGNGKMSINDLRSQDWLRG
jgi:uncharacterized protein with von Willebrand factor type A (vWA) domain